MIDRPLLRSAAASGGLILLLVVLALLAPRQAPSTAPVSVQESSVE